MYESRIHPPLTRPLFLRRLLLHVATAVSLLLVSLGVGMLGYAWFEHLPWLDGFLNSAMLLGGMGPVNAPVTAGGKLFAGLYALYAGLVFIVTAALVFTPIVHRVLAQVPLGRQGISAPLQAIVKTYLKAPLAVSIQTDDFAAPLPKRMLSGAPASPNEEAVERALRPKLLDEYVGQLKVREQLEIFISAAKMRGEALDHVLLFGPPGLGKTTLSHIIAHELGVNLRQTSGPVLEKPKDLAALLTNLEKNDVLFIDEIHRLSPVVEEILYPALEDYKIDIMIGEGPAARSIKLDLQPFTLVGATTRAGMLTNPLRDRFGIVARLEFYSPEELARIVKRSAGLLKVTTDEKGGFEIARRSRGTPRIANRLLRRVRDYADVKGAGEITLEVANRALVMLDVDPQGFDVMDRKLLEAVILRFDGGPVGLDNIAASIGEERETIEDVIEPYLIQQGYLQRTPRGRIATLAAYKHLGVTPPAAQVDGDMFGV